MTETRSSMRDEWRLAFRLMSLQTGMRVLTTYTWAIAISECVALVFARPIITKALGGTSILEGVLSSHALDASRAVIVALLAVGGTLLAYSPLSLASVPLVDLLSRRFAGVAGEERVKPIHGALFLARLSAIVPCCTAAGLLWTERDLMAGLRLLFSLLCLLVAAALAAAAIGAGAVFLHRSSVRKPTLVYLSVWLVPELLRLIQPNLPTCRSLLLGWLAIGSNWGLR